MSKRDSFKNIKFIIITLLWSLGLFLTVSSDLISKHLNTGSDVFTTRWRYRPDPGSSESPCLSWYTNPCYISFFTFNILSKSLKLTEVLRTSTTFSKTHNNMHLLNIESLCHVSDLNADAGLMLIGADTGLMLIGADTGWGRGHRSLLWVPGAVPMYLHVFK